MMTMRKYIQPLTEIHPAQLAHVVMYSVWDEMGEEGQFANSHEFEEEDDTRFSNPVKDKNWDKL